MARFPERNAEIIRRRKAGEKPIAIAKTLGLSRNVVLGTLRRAGLCDPTSPKAHNVRRPRVTDAFKEYVATESAGRSAAEAAREFGVADTTILDWRAEFGVYSRPRLKLTNEQVSEIKARRAAGEKLHVLGEDYGVHLAHISAICTGRVRRDA